MHNLSAVVHLKYNTTFALKLFNALHCRQLQWPQKVFKTQLKHICNFNKYTISKQVAFT